MTAMNFHGTILAVAADLLMLNVANLAYNPLCFAPVSPFQLHSTPLLHFDTRPPPLTLNCHAAALAAASECIGFVLRDTLPPFDSNRSKNVRNLSSNQQNLFLGW